MEISRVEGYVSKTSFAGLNAQKMTKLAKGSVSNVISNIMPLENAKRALPILSLPIVAGGLLIQKANNSEQELPFTEEPIIAAYGLDTADTSALSHAKDIISKAKDLGIDTSTLQGNISYGLNNTINNTGAMTPGSLSRIQKDTTALEYKIKEAQAHKDVSFGSNGQQSSQSTDVATTGSQDFSQLAEGIGDSVQTVGIVKGISQLFNGLINDDSKLTIKGSACLVDNTFLMPVKEIVIVVATQIGGEAGAAVGSIFGPGAGTAVGGAIGATAAGVGTAVVWAKGRDALVENVYESMKQKYGIKDDTVEMTFKQFKEIIGQKLKETGKAGLQKGKELATKADQYLEEKGVYDAIDDAAEELTEVGKAGIKKGKELANRADQYLEKNGVYSAIDEAADEITEAGKAGIKKGKELIGRADKYLEDNGVYDKIEDAANKGVEEGKKALKKFGGFLNNLLS